MTPPSPIPKRWMLTAAVLCAVACGGNTTLVQPNTFDRPGRVALVCYDTTDNAFVPMSDCDGTTLEFRGEERYVLIALVTQTARGEVAAVDLRDRLVLDADLRVPGFTFVRVGEGPSAVVVPENNPDFTYIANRTTRTIEWRDTRVFHPETVAELPSGALALTDGPVDLVASPDGAFLYAALPGNGTIAELAVASDGTLTLAREIPLTTTVPATVPPPAIIEYERICPVGREALIPSATLDAARTPMSIGAAPVPTRLVVDSRVDPPVLLVADEALPIIHRMALTDTGADEAALAPLSPAVPTRGIALTPNVPATFGGSALDSPARYLYAIDASDNSVLAMDYLEGSASFGAVLPVNLGVGVGTDVGLNQRDRLALAAGADVLEVLTPSYDIDAITAAAPQGDLCDPTDDDAAQDAVPAQHRGVFLAAGLQNGTMAIVDVYDLDAPCRGGADCEDPEQQSDVHVRIRRHRPRVTSLNPADMELIGQPQLTFDGAPGQIEVDGLPSTGRGPGMTPLGDCPAGMVKVFPTQDDAEPLICGNADAWSATAQAFEGVWEGVLPTAVGGQGAFDPNDETLFTARDARFCAWGTIGGNDVVASGLPETDSMAAYAGDRLLITGELPPDTQAALDAGDAGALERCRPFDIDDSAGAADREDIYLEITDATPTTLRVQLPIARNADGSPSGGATPVAYTLEDVRTCFPGAVQYAVHARSAFVVRGSTSAFLHRVQDIGGSCRIDPADAIDPNDPQTARTGRARIGSFFMTPQFAMQISATNQSGTDVVNTDGIEARLLFAIQGVPSRNAPDVGRIPNDILFSPTDDRVFVVDVGTSSLIQVGLDPLTFIDTVQ